MSTLALKLQRASAAGAWRASFGLALITLLGFGLLYCLAGTGLAQLLFPYRANGSLLQQPGRVVGSEWVAQPFAGPRWFHPRPSAAGYDPMAAAGSNQARSNPQLQARIAAETRAVALREGTRMAAVPSDLASQSGSGLDPHISPQAAALQVARVARARGLSNAQVEALLRAHVEPRQFGLLGQPRVNVLRLNLALEQLPRSNAGHGERAQ